MEDKKRNLSRLKASLLAFSMATTALGVSACSKSNQDELKDEQESGYQIVQTYPVQTSEGISYRVEYEEFIEDPTVGEVIIIKREDYNNRIKNK